MNIGLGVYDIFSRIVPGGFYLLVAVQFAVVMGWIKVDWAALRDVGILPSIAILIIGYIVGSAMDRAGSTWHRIFKKRGMSTRALIKFKDKHADRWVFDFEDKDWPILSTYIRMRNPEIALEIDRNNALCIMLRNLSLGLFLLAVTEVVQTFKTTNWLLLLLVAILVFLSIQIAIQARVLRGWFYDGVFEAILAYRLDLEDRVKTIKTTRTTKNGK